MNDRMTQPELRDVLSIRWGDSQDIAFAVGAIRTGGVDTRELARVQGIPSPGVWSLIGQVVGVDPLNVAVTFQLRVRVGVGSFTSTLTFPITPNTPFQIAMLPAQDVAVLIHIEGVVAVAGNWQFQAWLAPFIPWEGT